MQRLILRELLDKAMKLSLLSSRLIALDRHTPRIAHYEQKS